MKLLKDTRHRLLVNLAILKPKYVIYVIAKFLLAGGCPKLMEHKINTNVLSKCHICTMKMQGNHQLHFCLIHY